MNKSLQKFITNELLKQIESAKAETRRESSKDQNCIVRVDTIKKYERLLSLCGIPEK